MQNGCYTGGGGGGKTHVVACPHPVVVVVVKVLFNAHVPRVHNIFYINTAVSRVQETTTE